MKCPLIRTGCIGTVCLLLLCTLTVGCKKKASTNSSSSSTPSQTVKTVQPTPATDIALRPGQTCNDEDFEVTIINAKRATKYTKNPPEGQGYIVLRFKVKNISSEQQYGNISGDLQWKNPKNGMRDNVKRYTGVPLNNPEEMDLQPGQEAEFEEPYLVPNDMTEVEFHYVPGYNPKEKAKWVIPIE